MGVFGHRGSPRGVLEGEGRGVVLIEGSTGWRTARDGLAMEGYKWVVAELDGRAIQAWME
jgi:hypothetical protein